MLLAPAKYEKLNREAVCLFEDYGLSSYPLDVFALAGKMGIALIPYSSIPLAKRSAFIDVSKDAFTISSGDYGVDTTFICFNPSANLGRLRQSITHEIAHVWLEHPNSADPYETEAEYFAAYLLTPIPLLIKYEFTTPHAVHEAFLTSLEAARISLERASNRVKCGKPAFDYEYQIVELATLGGGGSLESA